MTPDALLANEIAASPDLFPALVDIAGDRVAIVRLSEALYREFSFLDERILSRVGPPRWVKGCEVDRGARGLAGESDFIFHIGHVGSTLVSRLLAVSERIFSVREPAILRTFAMLGADLDERRLEVFLRLWSRVYRPGQKSLIKATSFVSEIAGLLMTHSPSASAILMFVSPETYIASILGGENSRRELHVHTPVRLTRLSRRLGLPAGRLRALAEGEAAALGWICETCALAETAERFPDRVLWLDFEDFLARPESGLAAALARLHGGHSPRELSAMLSSPDFARYSKAPEHAYDAALRRRVLAQARSEHRMELARGIAWVNAAAAAFPAVAAAVTAAARSPRIG
jgi:hypothetical protein